MRIALVLLLACTFARANSLSDLKTALGADTHHGPIKVLVTYRASAPDEAEKPDSPGKVTAQVEDSSAGLQITWARAIMDLAIAEDVARGKDRNLRTPTRSAMDALNVTTLNNYLNAGVQLATQLEYAELLEERETTWENQPARLLTLKITPPMSEKDKKYIKEMSVTGKLWLGADGWPLAAEQVVDVKGRAMLVITFEQHERQELRYMRTAGRLVTVYHSKESKHSGAGEKNQNGSVATLEVSKL